MGFSPSATRILATLGPASNDRETILEMVKAGANAFRLNFSHGEQKDHADRVDIIREIAKETGQPIAILADLQGPKLRIGEVEDGVTLKKGDKFTFQLNPIKGDQEKFACRILKFLKRSARPPDDGE